MNDGDELREGDEVRSGVEAIVGSQRPPPGSAPGTLVPDPDAPCPVIRVLAYGPDRIFERRILDIDEVDELLGLYAVTWVNVDGLGDIETVQRIADKFGVHRLALEDVVSSHQRPKVEEYEEHTFVVIRMPHPTEERFDTEQLSLFLGDGYVLTFQESEGDCFDPVRDRLRTRRGQLRFGGGDYLTYALVDAVINSYFPVLENTGEQVELLEDELAERADPALIGRIHALKRDLLALRRVVWPQRELVNALIRDRSPRISELDGDLPPRLLRPCDHPFGRGRDLPRHRFGPARPLPLVGVDSAQRDHEGPDHHFDDLHPAWLHREPLRDEFRLSGLAPEHAGAALALGLSLRAGPDGGDRRGARVLFLAQGLDLDPPAAAVEIGRTRPIVARVVRSGPFL